MAQASGPSDQSYVAKNTEARPNTHESKDLQKIQSDLDASKDELLEEFCSEVEDDDEDTISNGSSDSDIIISVKEIEVGHDQQTQTNDFEESLVAENKQLRSEISENRTEIHSLKTKIVGLEKHVLHLQKYFDEMKDQLKIKPADCQLAKSLKNEVCQTKNVIEKLQCQTLDKKTAEKNSDKLLTKNLNSITFEIADVKAQIEKNTENHENLMEIIK